MSFYSIKQGVKNLIKWFPIIYHDRDWDHYYFYKILEKKLGNMEDFFVYDAYSTKANEDAHKLMIAKNLARRLANDDYLSNATIEYDKIYSNDDLFTFEQTNNRKFSKLVNAGTKQQHDMFGRCGKHSDIMRKQDREMLFDLLKKNIEGWWD
jgi:hypothetical protein